MSAKTKLIDFAVDYLRLVYDCSDGQKYPAFDLWFRLGLSDNSDLSELIIFGVEFIVEYRSVGNIVLLDFRVGLIRVFTIEKPLEIGIGRYQGFVFKFYGAFFQKKFVNEFLKSFFLAYPKGAKITRLDLALDVDQPVESVYSRGYSSQYKDFDFVKFNVDTKQFQTWYIGNRWSKNKHHFIRVYNKKLELMTKSSLKLAEFEKFRNYVKNYENVARIELQLNSVSCVNYTITPLTFFDYDHLKNVFSSLVINKSGTHLNILKNIFRQKSDILRVNHSEPSDIIDQVQYAKTMAGYVRNLEDNGFDTMEYLTRVVYSNR